MVARPGRHYEEQASALYCGEFLEGFSIADSASFDKWSLFTREQLRILACDLLRRLTEPPTGVSDASPVCDYARRWVTLDPLNEAAHRRLMRAPEIGLAHLAEALQFRPRRFE